MDDQTFSLRTFSEHQYWKTPSWIAIDHMFMLYEYYSLGGVIVVYDEYSQADSHCVTDPETEKIYSHISFHNLAPG